MSRSAVTVTVALALASLAACAANKPAASAVLATTEPTVQPTQSLTSTTGSNAPSITMSSAAPSVSVVTRTVTATPTASDASSSPPPPRAPSKCGDSDLAVTSTQLQHVPNTQRDYVIVTFTNNSAGQCTLYGYPGAALLGGATGSVYVNFQRRPGTPHLVTLDPGAQASTTLFAYFYDPSGQPCRVGELEVTPPNDYVTVKLPPNIEYCGDTIGYVVPGTGGNGLTM